VLLVEAGSSVGTDEHPGLAAPSFFEAVAVPGRTWPSITASRSAVQGAKPYIRGRGLGGSSAINAMVAMSTGPLDHQRWVAMGATEWGWRDVAPWYQRTDLVLNRPRPDEIGPLSARILEFVAELTRDGFGRRVSASDAYLDPARSRQNLRVLGHSHVDKVLIDASRAVGVRLADGQEIFADQVVISAGAIHSPAILMRSSIDRVGLGRNLKDHAALPLVLHRVDGGAVDASTLPISVVAKWSSGEDADDLQLLPLDHLGPDTSGLAMLMVALMSVESSGEIRLASADPLVDPIVEMRMLSTPGDVRRLHGGVSRAVKILRRPPFSSFVEVDDVDMSTEGLQAALGDYVHAAGTCRMGRVDDPNAVVDPWGRVIGVESLRVCDASVMPDLPRVNPHLMTVVLAERIADQMAASSSSIASSR
jgi:5-(hydroxymethyl)furfural/furfural oxidase